MRGELEVNKTLTLAGCLNHLSPLLIGNASGGACGHG